MQHPEGCLSCGWCEGEENVRKITIILSILLAGFLVVMTIHMRNEASHSAGRISNYRQQLEELQDQRLVLRAELEDLEVDSEGQEETIVSEVSLLIDGLGESVVYDELFPVMDSREMPGVLVLKQDRFPGLEDCMSLETFRELLSNGWSFSLYWDGDSDLDSAISEMESMLEEAELPAPDMIWSAKAFDLALFGDSLRRHGITLVAAPSFSGTEETNEDIILSVTARLDASRADSVIADASNGGLGTAFTVSTGAGVNVDDMAYVLDRFASQRSEGSLIVGGCGDFLAFRQECEDERIRMQSELQEQMQEIQEQIDALDEKISSLREAYFPDT